MHRSRLPMVILGGSDRRPGRLPPKGREKHSLSGYKGVEIMIQGRSIIEHLVERLRDSQAFDPILVAGPARLYERVPGVDRVIDTDGSFAQNIRTALSFMRREFAGMCIGVTTCDILPDRAELRALLDDYYQRTPCDGWYPLIRAPEDPKLLGEFGWKPQYKIVARAGEPAQNILPGHLAIFDPQAIRLGFLFGVMETAYRTRNRPLLSRRQSMVRHVLAGLILHDFLHILRFRFPSLTWTILRAGLRTVRKLREGTLERSELEQAFNAVVLKTRHRKRHPDRGVHIPVLDGLSIAKDVDTEEEIRQLNIGTEDE